MTINPDILEAAQQATLETDRLDAIATRTGRRSDKRRANTHYRDVEAPVLKALAAAGGNACLRPVEDHYRLRTPADDVYPHTARAAADAELLDHWQQEATA